MSMLPDPEPNRGAASLRRSHALLACASVALGLAALSTSGMAQAQGQPSAPSASAPAPAPQQPPAASAEPPASTPSAQPQAPPPAGAQPNGPQSAPPQGYGYPPPQQGYGYPPPQQGYGYPPPQGASGQTQPGYPPSAQYPYGYPYYPYYQPMTPPPRYERKSTGMMGGGIVLTTAGIIGVLVGSGLASTATNQIPVYCEPVGGGGPQICEYRDDDMQLGVGLGVLIAGFVGIGIGIPLWVIGGKRVPVKDQDAAPEAAPSAPQTSMQLLVGPQGASVRLSF